ncbi:hypothetical protein MQE22_12910 [Acidithiobacillus sp. YTS05]|nr:hypothetical protein MQE22_12910 [Acidithiobacillus sp. YTS05]
MNLHQISFSGALLERGFWLYVWRVKQNEQTVLYVGRTGDSSSQHASSPFSRLGQHLDVRPTAKANTLLRNIRAAGLDPTAGAYELLAIGPLFPEQTTMEAHRMYRDIVAALESALASHLRKSGHTVIGKHPKSRPYDKVLFQQVTAFLEGKL